MTHLVRQMSHVTFVPPDPERSAQDLVDLIGLRVSGRRDGTAFLTSNERLYEIAFRRAMKPEVAAIGLEAVDAGAVDEVRRRAVSDGLDYGWSMRADWPLGLASLTEKWRSISDMAEASASSTVCWIRGAQGAGE
jgi:hypothetical protein